MIQSQLNDYPESPSSRLGRPLPPKLEALILECLEKDPNRRPSSAKDLLDRLAALDDVNPWDADQARSWWGERKTA